ncbi:MAG: T9SS type A sorting domain-containing protein [Crocinitomicaceae bacterium]|nr:T9SS type A sorting domain-containing protein [Crocinitomicaceae bacterium]
MKKIITGVIGVALLAIALFAFIDLDNLDNYTGQGIPSYITKDNTPSFNLLSNPGATLGRVLFYDKNLSSNSTVSCASCHLQSMAFGDATQLSTGLNGGSTGRHAMRLAYSRFGEEERFFWDERAESAEDQVRRPIKDFVEMGFSGTNGQPGFDSLINKLSVLPYYQTLFTFVFGDSEITEERMQRALAQFVRSIYSFDSRFDEGLAAAGDLNADFANYTEQENLGKHLFLTPVAEDGTGCQECHRAPEFDIDPASKNNGLITVANHPELIDTSNTRSPSLRDLFSPMGAINGPMMHDGSMNINQVMTHYNEVPQDPANTFLDDRLTGAGGSLGLTTDETAAVIAFLRTLSSQAIYTEARWSDPFDENGNLDVIMSVFGASADKGIDFEVYPNPASDQVRFTGPVKSGKVSVFNSSGQLVKQETFRQTLDISTLSPGIYYLVVRTNTGQQSEAKRLIVE